MSLVIDEVVNGNARTVDSEYPVYVTEYPVLLALLLGGRKGALHAGGALLRARKHRPLDGAVERLKADVPLDPRVDPLLVLLTACLRRSAIDRGLLQIHRRCAIDE